MAGRRFRLVEITGVAGAGKSTIARLICGEGDDCRTAEFIHARRPAHLARLAHAVPGLLPILARNVVRPPRLSWPDVKLLAYVAEWRRFLGRRTEHPGLTLFDQGPVYALVRLRAQARGVTRTAAFERWWGRMLEGWAEELDAVVYLDAADPVLLERIDGRDQPHRTKGGSAEEGLRFLGTYRRLFDDALRRLDVPGGPEILRFDTSGEGAEQIASDIRSILRAGSAARVADAGGLS